MTRIIREITLMIFYVDILLEKDGNVILTTQLYQKRENFNFYNVNSFNLCTNMPSLPAS